jgi:hypothetical protein
VGLCNVAGGCVRKKVRKRTRFDNAGELDPYESTIKFHILAASPTAVDTGLQAGPSNINMELLTLPNVLL